MSKKFPFLSLLSISEERISMKKIFVSIFLLFFSIIRAQEINFYGEAKEGSIIIGVGKNISRVTFNNQKLLFDKSGLFLFGFDRDTKGKQKLNVTFKNKKSKTFVYNIEKREYETQRLKIARKYVVPLKRELSRIKKEAAEMKAARAKFSKSGEAMYSSGFAYPVDSVDITGVFGSQRVLNGRKANIHNGLDFGANEGDSIRAIAGGIVRIAGEHFYYNGNFVLLDHGQGLSSVYLHMSKLLVETGQKVKKGEAIGLVGATGRATGPHLHLGVQWYKKRIDPMSLFEIKNIL